MFFLINLCSSVRDPDALNAHFCIPCSHFFEFDLHIHAYGEAHLKVHMS